MNHYQFLLILGQDAFYPGFIIKTPFQAIVTYKVDNDQIEVVDVTLPYCILECVNLQAVRSQAKAAAENNAIEMGYIGKEMMVTVYELLKINP